MTPIKIETPQEAWAGVAYRMLSAEELLLEKIRKGQIAPSSISIIKLGLTASIPAGYNELPKGLIRGLYVQHILEKKPVVKSVPEIITLASNVDSHVWLNLRPAKAITSETKAAKITIAETNTSIQIYPNPVSDILNISGNKIEQVKIYTLSGGLVLTATNNTGRINVSHLAAGIYIVKAKAVDGKEEILKIIKK